MLRRLQDLATAYGLDVPPIVAFHAAHRGDQPRACVFTPVGAGAESLLASLEGNASPVQWSIAVCGAIGSHDDAITDSLVRVDVPLIATSADAPFGNVETDLIRRAAARGLPFAVALLGLDGRGFLDEIETYRLTPLRAELGDFPMFVDDPPALRTWVESHAGEGRRRQFAAATTEWRDALQAELARRREKDDLRAARIERVEIHLAELAAYMRDLLQRDLPVPALNALLGTHMSELSTFYADVIGPWPYTPAGDPGAAIDVFRDFVAMRIAAKRATLIWHRAEEDLRAIEENGE